MRRMRSVLRRAMNHRVLAVFVMVVVLLAIGAAGWALRGSSGGSDDSSGSDYRPTRDCSYYDDCPTPTTDAETPTTVADDPPNNGGLTIDHITPGQCDVYSGGSTGVAHYTLVMSDGTTVERAVEVSSNKEITSDDEFGDFAIPVKIVFVPIDGGTPACGVNTDGLQFNPPDIVVS